MQANTYADKERYLVCVPNVTGDGLEQLEVDGRGPQFGVALVRAVGGCGSRGVIKNKREKIPGVA